MPTLLVFLRFIRAIRDGLKEPEFRAMFLTIITLLLSGTWFYHRWEGWSWLDSLYFTVITLTTVGYGDLSPTTPVSKIFTIVFIFVGLGVFTSFIYLLAERLPGSPFARLNKDRSKPEASGKPEKPDQSD